MWGNDAALWNRHIQTKQICFAWNLLPNTSALPTKLKGQRHKYTAEHTDNPHQTDQLRKLKCENAWPHLHVVTSTDDLVGEMAIRHPKRWTLASDKYTENYGMVGHMTDDEDI
jgi:hypothetical protein